MVDKTVDRLHIGKLPTAKRKNIRKTLGEMIQAKTLFSEKRLPLVIEPSVADVDLIFWAKNNQDYIEEHVLKHGAILFRNFGIRSIPIFRKAIDAMSGGAIEYRFRASPRSEVGEKIYTSTDYPPDQTIFPHNEHSYSPVFPLRIFLCCITSAKEGGETPIGDCRQIFERIPSQIRERFKQKKIMYLRNYNDGFGLPWQTVFQTTDRAEVEVYCRKHDIEFEWKSGDRLRTRQVGPAIVRHPRTNEHAWFNHATFFHVSTLPTNIRDGVLSSFKEEDLPNNTYYGDGSPIEPSVLDELRGVYQHELLAFPWQPGDMLMVDNMLTVHGRRPYRGARKVVVGMAEPTSWQDIRVE